MPHCESGVPEAGILLGRPQLVGLVLAACPTVQMAEIDYRYRRNTTCQTKKIGGKSSSPRSETGEFDIIIMSPPCSTWSRAVSANRLDSKPVRSREFPFGFPWLKGDFKEKAELGTLLVMRCIETKNGVAVTRDYQASAS